MRFYRLLLVLALAAGGSLVAHADLQPSPDPFIGIDDPQNGTPISTSSTCTPTPPGTPTGAGGGICDFYNPYSTAIIQLEFTVDVSVPGLGTGFGLGAYPSPPASPIFECAAPGVFTTCLIAYDTPPLTPTDEVTFFFYGTDAADPGIPPLLPGCASNPNSTNCDTVGFFEVNLNDNNSLTGTTGGWNSVDAGTFQTISIQTAVPEPSMTLLLAAGSILVFGLSRRRLNRESR